jgi:murein DD-endopeptidase MepM/ murein hydrolase activator NlpD
MIGPIDKFDAQDLIAGRAQALGQNGNRSTPAEKKKAAEDFVALLFMEVLKTMRASIPKGGLFDSDSIENDVYTSMSDTEVARAIAGREALGLRRMIEKALDHKTPGMIDDNSSQNAEERPTRLPGADRNVVNPASKKDVAATIKPHQGLEAPVHGNISSKFGVRADPWTGSSQFHKGLDIAAAAGSPVKAAAAGTVVFSGWANGYGNLVTVDHGNGTLTRYGHNGINLVQTGDAVAAGQEIALVGATGRATGPHLHFEVERDGEAVDPGQTIDFKQLIAKAAGDKKID